MSAELHVDEDDTFSILSIDPGTSTLGFCVTKLKIETLEIVDVFAWTVDATRLAFYKDEIIEIHGEKFARILSHKRNLEQVLRFYDPLFVVCETPFFNRLRPSAGGPLYELYATVEQTVYEWDKYKPLYGVDPKTVKKAVKALGNKKPDMLIAMKKIAEIFEKAGLDLLDEHAIDAVAVGYTKVLELRERKAKSEADRKR
jgi:Holliday junction resolvasome RuvABC endonuclease subunit